MINENTWHRDVSKQKNFVWEATGNGVELHHSTSSYTIPWDTFNAVYIQARAMASHSSGIVTVGTSMTAPTAGSVGEWVVSANLAISNGILTPRHLSFLGPIFGRMGFVQRELSGNSIQWIVV